MAIRSIRNGLWILGGAAVLVGVAVGLRLALRDSLEPRAALAVLDSFRGRPGAGAAFVLAYMGLTSAFVPATLLHMVAGAAWGFRTGLFLNLTAFHVTSNLHFWLARRLGRSTVERWAGGARMLRIEAKLAREGLRAAMLVRVLPLPNLAVNLAAGMSSIRWRDFALGTLIGTLPVISVYTYFAAALVEDAIGAKRDALVHTAIGAVLVILVALLTRVVAARRSAVD
ncbi:MAG: VTT domain-containing protein [Myxococcaceae bacterium]